jgi:hypothetical protein
MAHHVFHRGSIGGVVPAPTFAGLTLYDWDAATLAATPVSSWTDSGQGIELTQSGTARPAWSASGGAQALAHPAVLYDGVDDFLESAGSQALDWSGGISMFLVKERVTIAGFAGPYLMRAQASARTAGNFEAEASLSQQIMNFATNRDSTLGGYISNTAAINTTDPVLWSLRMIDSLGAAGSPDPFRQNEVDVTTGELAGVDEAPQSLVDIIELGHGYNGAKWNAYVYRQMFYTGRDMTAAEETEVINYLNTKYGVY